MAARLHTNIIPLGESNVSKEGLKFKIYLPMRLNYLWKELYEKQKKVRVYIEIVDEEEQQ